ncbi:MAG: hypothetical protein Q9165_007365 [Trypethelium subeluteriae]
MASPQSSSNEVSQYHHFIPQFILRNFAHVYRPIGKHRHRRGNGKSMLRNGDQALNTINLSTDSPELVESPVRRSFGLVDMYRDFTKVEDQQYLEKHLGKLESQAAQIINRVCKAFNNGNHTVWISRPERNNLRKFFFLMKYRGKGFHRRFLGDTTQGYVEDDKDKFLEYMRKRNFRNPLDVWFHSIKTILDLQMDVQSQWTKTLINQIYPDDAYWFFMHSEMMYLAFCTPSDPNMEFIVTENCYAISEGPFSLSVDPITKKQRTTAWTSYHEFGPLSPKLVMVLRSFLLPNSEEDRDEDMKKWREKMFASSSSKHANPSATTSVLVDLPVTKAGNSYSAANDTRVQLRDGEDGSKRSYHKFCFEFFKIPTGHVNTINTVMLDNAHEHERIAFASRDSLRETLEHYITLTHRGFKVVSDEVNDSRLQYLRKLEQVLHMLGSNGRLVYRSCSIPDQEHQLVMLGQDLEKNMPEEPSEYTKLHLKLGGSLAGMFVDFDQARKMLNMRIKIDVWSRGVDENIRQQARENLTDLFCQHIPLQRLWLYVKDIRNMLLGAQNDTNNIRNSHMEQVPVEGPEDVIVKSTYEPKS